MKTVTFKQFICDYNEYYNEDVVKLKIQESDIGDVIFDIYDSDNYEINYNTKIIEIY